MKEKKEIISDQERTKKKKIFDLAKYFADRYNLILNDEYENTESEMYGNYVTQITRIMKKVYINEQKLWDILKIDKKPRMISINDFIYYCFPEWKRYIENNHLDEIKKNPYAHKSFLEDKKIFDILRMEKKLEDKQIEFFNDLNSFYEEGYLMMDPAELPIEYSENSDEVKLKGYGFMIEAIYNIFFLGFDWESLAKDMTLEANRCSDYNTMPTKEETKAVLSLMDYRNYTIGKLDENEDTK